MVDIVLIDGNNILFRSHYGRSLILDAKGRQIQGIAGVVNVAIQHYLKLKPKQIFVCWDTTEKTFRHELYPKYKSRRSEYPSELLEQIDRAKKALENLGICQIEATRFEADDCIGTLAYQATLKDKLVSVVSGDRDLWQLISRNVSVEYWPIKKNKEVLTLQGFQERFQIEPGQILDYKALVGDASDNIPGVPGIGDKTVWPLLQQGLTLKDLLERPDLLKPSQAQKLIKYKDQALLSRELAKIIKDIPLNIQEREINIASNVAKSTLRILQLNQLCA